MKLYKGYEAVIGLEVHIELRTRTKIFCSCPTAFGAEPNTQCCPVCTGMPGALPTLNRAAVELAVKAGLVTGCKIAKRSKMDRKNYFYPDLPKAYQISQYDCPLCEHGALTVETEQGSKRIGITRIHLEEDAGKLIHDKQYGTMIDCNRCGIPLIEVVSEPDLRSAEEAVAYVKKLRSLMLYAGVSDCKMQEGSLRCDVNLSVRKAGDCTLGVRTEIKNLNSFTQIQKAIESEYKRQADALECGESVVQETRRFDPKTGGTHSMRRKENADDYRFFPEPDLLPFDLPEDLLRSLREELPVLPDERKRRYTEIFGLRAYDSELLTESRVIADFFEACASLTAYPQILANLLIGEIFRLLPADPTDADVKPTHAHFAEVATLFGEGVINSSVAKKLAVEVWETDLSPTVAVSERGLAQVSDSAQLEAWLREALDGMPTLAYDYQRGKTKALTALLGKAMALSNGKANPSLLRELALKLLLE